MCLVLVQEKDLERVRDLPLWLPNEKTFEKSYVDPYAERDDKTVLHDLGVCVCLQTCCATLRPMFLGLYDYVTCV